MSTAYNSAIKHRWKTAAQLFGLLSVMYVGSSYANIAENIAVDMRSMSMGNAIVADTQSPVASIHYNPAGLTKVQGLETQVQGVALDFGIRNEFIPNKDFEVFTYSDDPVVCKDDPVTQPDGLCHDFKDYGVSKVENVAIFSPFSKKMIALPKDLQPALPMVSAAYNPPGSRFTYGTAVYGQMLGGYWREETDPGVYMGQKLAMQRLVYAAPTVAYQVDDNLSIGAGVNLTYAAIGLQSQLRFPNELIGVFRFLDEEVCAQFKENGNLITDLFLLGLCNTREGIGPFKPLGQMEITMDDTVSPNYNIGVLWEPSDRFAWGLTYRSSAPMHLKGKYTINNSPASQQVIRALNSSTTGSILVALLGFPNYVPPVETGLVYAELEYPSSIQTGIKYKLFPNMQFNVDVHWMDWSKWGNLSFSFDREISVLKLAKLLSPDVTSTSLSMPTNYESVWSLAFGWEYSMTDRLRFRLGYEPRRSSIPLNKRSPLLPINNTQLFGSGIGYSFDPNTEIDLNLSYIRSADNIPANSSSFANSTSINNFVLNPYAGLDIKTRANIIAMGIAYRTRW